MAVVKGKWYVVGRELSGAWFLSVYNPATNTWTKRAAPPATYVTDSRSGSAAARSWSGSTARLELAGGVRTENNWQYTP